MCYSATVSAGTFLFVGAVGLYLWKRNRGLDRPLGLILGAIALMQLLEWGLWLNLECGAVNKFITAVIPVYLALQPVLINWIVGAFDAGWANYYWEVGLVAAATIVPYQIYKAVTEYGVCSRLDTGGHIVWKNFSFGPAVSAIYYPAMLYPLLTLRNTTFSIIYSFFGLLSHQMFSGSGKESWPSLWCHFVNALAAFAVVRGAP